MIDLFTRVCDIKNISFDSNIELRILQSIIFCQVFVIEDSSLVSFSS